MAYDKQYSQIRLIYTHESNSMGGGDPVGAGGGGGGGSGETVWGITNIFSTNYMSASHLRLAVFKMTGSYIKKTFFMKIY